MTISNALSVSYSPNLPWSTEFLLLETDGSVVDLTGAELRMMVRSQVDSDVVLAIASTANGKITFKSITTTYKGNEVTGVGVEVTLNANDTLNIYENTKTYGEGKAKSDIELTFLGQTPIPNVIDLSFEPKLSVTRDFDA